MIGTRSVFYLGLLLLSAYFTGSLFYFYERGLIHCISLAGEKAYLFRRDDPSWLPTMLLGHDDAATSCSSARYDRAVGRKRKEADAVSALLKISRPDHRVAEPRTDTATATALRGI